MKKQFLLGIILCIGICLSLILFNSSLSVYGTNSNVIKRTFNNQLTLQLPHSTRAIESKIIEHGELLYSVYLDDQTLLIRGYIQLWNLGDLEKYLVDSQRISTFDFRSYTLKPIKVANLRGYLTEWTASFGESYKLSGMEYWLKKTWLAPSLQAPAEALVALMPEESIQPKVILSDSIKKSATSDVLRISFFTDTTSFSKEQIEYIDKIISSVIWSN